MTFDKQTPFQKVDSYLHKTPYNITFGMIEQNLILKAVSLDAFRSALNVLYIILQLVSKEGYLVKLGAVVKVRRQINTIYTQINFF